MSRIVWGLGIVALAGCRERTIVADAAPADPEITIVAAAPSRCSTSI